MELFQNKGMTPHQKKKRIKDKKLLQRIRELPCANCGSWSGVSPHHIISVGAGGVDLEENLLPLCTARCHRKIHDQGLRKFLEKSPHVRILLKRAGWVINDTEIYHPTLLEYN